MNLRNNIHCAFDLECEQPKTNPQTPDSVLDVEQIIQIGYVIYELEPDFKILKNECLNINIGVPISKFIQTLTGIKNKDIESGVSFGFAYNKLVDDVKAFGCSRILKQWGGGDQDLLKKEAGDNRPWPFGRSACNVKHLYQIYAEANGMNTSGGLSKCLNRVRLGWSGGAKHNAENDAFNTARMHHFIYNSLKTK